MTADALSNNTVLVVGAGPSGLGCAIELAAARPVVLLERIPVAGGTASWDNPLVKNFTVDAQRAGVHFRLGQCAIRWEANQLLVAAPGRFDHLAGSHLFFAGGLRPATTADMRVTGDRPAGVVPATVAEHLLQAGVRLWRTVVIIGDGQWAHLVADRAKALGSRVIALSDNAEWADERVDRPEQWSIIGRDRIQAVRLVTTDGVLDVPCDGLVLAADPVPNRNIDGAVLPDSPSVTFIQPLTPHDPASRYRAARAVARQWLHTNGKVHR